MKSFILYENGVIITTAEGQQRMIYFNQDSGKLFYRYKIDTQWNTKHAAIYVGVDGAGTHYFMHNHYQIGQPCVATLAEFTLDQPCFLYETTVTNSWIQIIENGLNQVLRGQPYHSTNYNCQTFVSRACNNTNYSEDVDKWIGRIAVGSAVVVGLNLLFKRNF